MATGDGIVWDETAPTNATNISDGDDHILDIRKGVRSRLIKEHVWPATQANTGTAGYHQHVTFQPYASGTTPATFITGTTAGAIGCCTYGTGQGIYVAVGTKDVLLVSDVGLNPGTMFGLASQTAGNVFVSTGTSGLSVVAGSTGQVFVLSGTVATFSNTFSVGKTFAGNITLGANITAATGTSNMATYLLAGTAENAANGMVKLDANKELPTNTKGLYNDYGTSASAYTANRYNQMKICYGSVTLGNNGTQAITNLPFTSNTSYLVFINANTSSGSFNKIPSYVMNSGAQFTITNEDGDSGNILFNWLAIGI